jgi:predicted SAM-dependent methyltransferase
LKLHLGCGPRHLEGFIHIDIDNQEHIDFPNTDISNLDMIEDETVDLIYTCGSFEYFDREKAPSVLKEWKRVLKLGGQLKVSVPDFQSITEVYIKNKDVDGIGILGPLYGKWQVNDGDYVYHKTVYDFASLRSVLENSGFSEVKNYNAFDFLPEGYDDYSLAYVPHMDRNGIQMHLNVECIK